MRKYFTLLTLLASAATMAANAQSPNGKIAGSVQDPSQKALAAATISLLHAKDSAIAKINAADKEGRFQFEGIANGAYLISVSAVGHVKTFSKHFELSPTNTVVNLQPIVVSPASKEMAGVTVVASKPMIEQKIDRTVLNVDASVTNVGATALEVLEKAPGVTVDKDGNISLKGKQGVMVMMDGRPTYLSATELSNYLKSLPATAIDQIEIMTNPSSKYDAAGNSGIINIKSKKNRQKGFNGSLTANYGQGVYWKNNESINLNYRTGKLNLFANGGISFWNGFQTLTIHREFKNPSSKELNAIFDQVSNMRNSSDYYNLKVGADYYLSKKTTLGFVTSGFFNDGSFTSNTTSYLKNASNTLDSIVVAHSVSNSIWKNGSLNLNMRHQFDSTGRELTADLDYVKYDSRSIQSFSSVNYNIDMVKRGEEALRATLPVDINIYTAKMDYAQPFGKEGKLEAGVKTGYVATDNGANYFIPENGSEQIDYRKSNNFEYKENIAAAYVNINKQFKKFGVQGGLRYEYTTYTGNQYGNPQRQDSSFTSSYGSLFPTVFVSYKMNDKNQFGASFARRIDRPAYQDLNPFLEFIDVYTYEQGNPFLRPQFT
ncbi:MAG: outer membrane beta-barrel protein, partial [Chitinophagaceae bacterium]